MTLQYHTPLDTDALRDLGIPEPWRFGIADRTHWSDMDPLAHVNNAAYLAWFENVRLAWLQARGITAFTEGAPKFVIRQVGIDYLGEVRMAEDYIVAARIRDYRTSSFTMEYGVFVLRDGKPVLCTTSHAVLVMLTPDGSAKLPLWPELISLMEEKDGAVRA